MFNERINKLDTLKPITIEYNGALTTINNFEDLQKLMDQAVEYDIKNNSISDNNKSFVRRLKGLIFSEYLKSTDEFRESIFNQN